MQGYFGGAKGVSGDPYSCKQARRTACTKQQEKVKTNKFVVVRKVAKNDKNGKQHKMFKKKLGKKKKESKTRSETPRHVTPSPLAKESRQKQQRTT